MFYAAAVLISYEVFGAAGALVALAAVTSWGFMARRSSMRTLLAGAALFDLTALGGLFLLLRVLRPDGGFAASVLLAVTAGLLAAASRARVGYPEWFLPVRGIHARKLTAALAILAAVGASPLGWLASELPNQPGSQGVPVWVWLIGAGLPGYFAPLWQTLVHGWEGEEPRLAPPQVGG